MDAVPLGFPPPPTADEGERVEHEEYHVISPPPTDLILVSGAVDVAIRILNMERLPVCFEW